ncbi:MAG: ROK family protein [Actinomycetota bacterium]
MDHALAIDIGGSKMAVGVVDECGRLRERRSVATPTVPRQDSAPATVTDAAAVEPGDGAGAPGGEDVFAALADLVSTFAPFDRFAVCGVGCAGPIAPGGETVSPLNIPGLRAFPLAERLTTMTGLSCRVDNDAKALALAEGWVGGAVGVADYLAMVVSTGVGSGIVLEGRLLDGASGNAGHIGQMAVTEAGRPMPPQAEGTLEAEAAGPAIAAHTGRRPEEAATVDVARAGTLVGRAAGSVANLLDLRLVLVAGSVALGFGEPFFAAAQAEMDRICTLEFSRGARIQPAGCGHEGPLIGAAAVGFRSLGRRIGAVDPQ